MMRPRRVRAFSIEQLEPRMVLSNFYVAPTGSDSAPGTISAPWKTPQHAAASVAAGDVINLRAGTYSGTVTIDSPDVTVRSYPGERAAIVAPTNDPSQGNVLWFHSTGGKALNLDVRGGYYYGIKYEFSGGLVDGCSVSGTGYYGIKMVAHVDNVTVRNTEIGNTGRNSAGGGIDSVDGDNILIQDNYIHDVTAEGIVAKGGSIGAVIERNRVENSTYAGILVGQFTGEQYFDTNENPNYYENIDAVVRNNIVRNTDGAGIAMYAAKSPQIYNNTLIDTARSVGASIIVAAQTHSTAAGPLVISTTDPSIVNNIVTRTTAGSRPLIHVQNAGYTGTLTLDHNRYYNGGGTASFWDDLSGNGGWYGDWSTWPTHIVVEVGSSQGDPVLDATGHLAAGSPVIGAGRALAAVADDIDRDPRTGRNDIGAAQAPSSPSPSPAPSSGSLWGASAAPASDPSGDPAAIELGVRFRSDADGYVTGVRFYKGAGNDGTHTGSLWSASGQLLATATFSGESASGWQTVTFASPVRISAGATYTASYHTATGHYMADRGAFASAGRDSGVLHALRGADGVYAYGGGGVFPSGSYQSTNYWVDVLYATA